MRVHPTLTTFLVIITVLLTSCEPANTPTNDVHPSPRIHYLEIVTPDVTTQCAALERLHELTFGPPVADLGQARVAQAPDGSLIGVRAPLAEHEQPIVRTYLEVEDIAQAVQEVEAAGGVVAYPPTRQGETGTWAIYFVGGVQMGLWQR